MPTSSMMATDDAYELDDIREALCRGDVVTALRQTTVYTLTLVAVLVAPYDNRVCATLLCRTSLPLGRPYESLTHL